MGDGGDQPGGGSVAEKQAALQRKIELNEAYELEHDCGLFGSMYVSQVPGVAAGCDDDPDEDGHGLRSLTRTEGFAGCPAWCQKREPVRSRTL